MGWCRAGIDLPKVEVRFQNLTVEGNFLTGDRALPTLPNVARNIAESVLSGCLGIKLAGRAKHTILKDASGIIKPSRYWLMHQYTYRCSYILIRCMQRLSTKMIDRLIEISKFIISSKYCDRMTLLLGPPSSGKTTLLLALAGMLDSNLKVSHNLPFFTYVLGWKRYPIDSPSCTDLSNIFDQLST